MALIKTVVRVEKKAKWVKPRKDSEKRVSKKDTIKAEKKKAWKKACMVHGELRDLQSMLLKLEDKQVGFVNGMLATVAKIREELATTVDV